MTDKPWLEAYPPGVPADIDPAAYRSLKALLESSFERYAALPAFVNHGTTLTFAEVEEASRHLAAYLQTVAGLERGDRIALMMPNLLQYPVAAFAALRAGLVVVNVNPLYTSRELEHQLTDSGAKAVIVLENFAHTLAAALTATAVETVIVTRFGDHFPRLKAAAANFIVRYVKRLVPPWRIAHAVRYSDALAAGRSQGLRDVELGPDDVAFLQYTGGTTGIAKGAMLTHRNVVSNVMQAVAWARPFIHGRGDVVVTPLPLYHIFSLTANLLAFVELGGLDLLITDPRDLPALIKDLKSTRFTYITGVNTLFNALLHAPGFAELDFSSLKVSMGGGMAVQRSVAEEWRRVTGGALAQGYGLTETSPIVCASPLDGRDFDGSVGLPLPSTEVAICDEQGQPLPADRVGEICVRGPQVMAGYWQRAAETAAVLTSSGWLHTGDMGHMDARGFVFIEDRKKDMIIVSGFKVYPNEVEEVLVAHPGVREAAVVGMPSEHSGEAVKAYVVKKDPTLTAEELIAYTRERLTAYKVPHVVEFRSDLPKSNVGKVLRRALKDEGTQA